MAGSLTRKNSRIQERPPLSEAQMRIADALADGHTVREVVRRLARGDRKRAKAWRNKIRTWAREDPRFVDRIHANSKADIQLGLPKVTEALMARAGRGRPDAVKLAYAASNFYNDKVQHEHSGGIEISVSIPRPPTTQDQLGPGKEYVDSDAVEVGPGKDSES